MTGRFATPQPEVPRDGWGRPKVKDGSGKLVPYTRCTTFVGAAEDTYNLSRWQMRMVALGMADRQDLQLAAAAHREDKEKLNGICEQALEAAKGKAGATTGTALHAITETHDRGLDVGSLPATAQADLDAYVEATKELQAVMIEQFMVLDTYKIGGTPDRVVKFNGKRYIADLKTGSIDYGYLKIAAQLAVYARSRPYHPDKGRLDPHGAEVDKGIIIHLPAGTGTCTLHWIDLIQGWEVVKLCRTLRATRSMKFGDFLRPLDPTPEPMLLDDLAVAIYAADTREAVLQLWSSSPEQWTEQHTELAKEHLASLEGNTDTTTTSEGARA